MYSLLDGLQCAYNSNKKFELGNNYENILTELEEYYKEQLEFIIELPAYTKDITQEHKVMELCYEDFLNKIQELKEKYK